MHQITNWLIPYSIFLIIVMTWIYKNYKHRYDIFLFIKTGLLSFFSFYFLQSPFAWYKIVIFACIISCIEIGVQLLKNRRRFTI